MSKLEGIQGAVAEAVICLSSMRLPSLLTLSGFSMLLMGCPGETTIDSKSQKVSDHLTLLSDQVGDFARSYERTKEDHATKLFANSRTEGWEALEEKRLALLEEFRAFEGLPKIHGNQRVKWIIDDMKNRIATLCKNEPIVGNAYQSSRWPINQESLTRTLLPRLQSELRNTGLLED